MKESRRNKDKEEEEQVEKKEAEEPCSRVASGEAALVGKWQFLTMVKNESLLSMGLCRFLEFMEWYERAGEMQLLLQCTASPRRTGCLTPVL